MTFDEKKYGHLVARLHYQGIYADFYLKVTTVPSGLFHELNVNLDNTWLDPMTLGDFGRTDPVEELLARVAKLNVERYDGLASVSFFGEFSRKSGIVSEYVDECNNMGCDPRSLFRKEEPYGTAIHRLIKDEELDSLWADIEEENEGRLATARQRIADELAKKKQNFNRADV